MCILESHEQLPVETFKKMIEPNLEARGIQLTGSELSSVEDCFIRIVGK